MKTITSFEEYVRELLSVLLHLQSNSEKSDCAYCHILKLARFIDTLPWDKQPAINVREFYEASRESIDLACIKEELAETKDTKRAGVLLAAALELTRRQKGIKP